MDNFKFQAEKVSRLNVKTAKSIVLSSKQINLFCKNTKKQSNCTVNNALLTAKFKV
jgi:hypothetical protein